MALNPIHQTKAELAARFWSRAKQKYQESLGTGHGARVAKCDYAEMIWWISNRVAAGDITNNDVRLSYNAAFGKSLTAGQWTTLVTGTFTPIRDKYQALIDQGEV